MVFLSHIQTVLTGLKGVLNPHNCIKLISIMNTARLLQKSSLSLNIMSLSISKPNIKKEKSIVKNVKTFLRVLSRTLDNK